MKIRTASPGEPEVAAFIHAHLADLEPTAPRESRHALDAGGLEGATVWVAESGDSVLGMAALVTFGTGEAELKSMRTDPLARGRGVASALLAHVVDHARARGIGRISLETGSASFFAPARALYVKHGFVPCGPFGSYREDPHSVYFTREVGG